MDFLLRRMRQYRSAVSQSNLTFEMLIHVRRLQEYQCLAFNYFSLLFFF